MSDGMIYLLFLVCWLLMLAAMRLGNRADNNAAYDEGQRAGYAKGRNDERAYQRNIEARWHG